MTDCKRCSIAARSVLVAFTGVVGLIMFIVGVSNVGKTGTSTVSEYAAHEHFALLALGGALTMIISLLLPFFCVTECGDNVQRRMRIRNGYDLVL